MAPSALYHFHRRMLEDYGPQGWWPLLAHPGCNPTKTGAITGYHPGDYSFPRDAAQRFEIGVGAILTQNTAWTNVEKALLKLQAGCALDPVVLLDLAPEDLAERIRPSGYFNAKARKLREWAAFFQALGGASPTREALLGVWGIGPETADSIRLYAYGELEMVVDAYTRRVLEAEGFIGPGLGYEALKDFCVRGLPAEVTLYQEWHALLVEHAKRSRGKA
nr:endonuclease III domain-containing protein [uncultured Holophaga sp.]